MDSHGGRPLHLSPVGHYLVDDSFLCFIIFMNSVAADHWVTLPAEAALPSREREMTLRVAINGLTDLLTLIASKK
jgi:hypothetical protein